MLVLANQLVFTYGCCVDTEFSIRELPRAVADRDGLREKERVCERTLWYQQHLMMYIYIYIYIYKFAFRWGLLFLMHRNFSHSPHLTIYVNLCLF